MLLRVCISFTEERRHLLDSRRKWNVFRGMIGGEIPYFESWLNFSHCQTYGQINLLTIILICFMWHVHQNERNQCASVTLFSFNSRQDFSSSFVFQNKSPNLSCCFPKSVKRPNHHSHQCSFLQTQLLQWTADNNVRVKCMKIETNSGFYKTI